MKYNFDIKEVSKETALNKYFLGVHLDGTLVDEYHSSIIQGR